MSQAALFELKELSKIINVASVPQRSPFRYPGGKTWLVPRIRQWLNSLAYRPRIFIEPFAGGGIVSLTVAAESLADQVLMVELDEQVAAVWKTVLNGRAEWLAERIMSFDLTLENAQQVLSEVATSDHERAFQTILKNRTFHGGILANGSRMLNYGENGKGIKSRWYPETLKKRILEIHAIRERIVFLQGDGLEIIKAHSKQANAAYFIDPPYTAAGKKAGSRLYTHFDLDHKALFEEMHHVRGDFLMTYDNAVGVRELAESQGFDMQFVAMKNKHHAEMTELLIGRDLFWTR